MIFIMREKIRLALRENNRHLPLEREVKEDLLVVFKTRFEASKSDKGLWKTMFQAIGNVLAYGTPLRGRNF